MRDTGSKPAGKEVNLSWKPLSLKHTGSWLQLRFCKRKAGQRHTFLYLIWNVLIPGTTQRDRKKGSNPHHGAPLTEPGLGLPNLPGPQPSTAAHSSNPLARRWAGQDQAGAVPASFGSHLAFAVKSHPGTHTPTRASAPDPAPGRKAGYLEAAFPALECLHRKQHLGIPKP